MATLPVAPPRPPVHAAPLRNRASYTADGDNPNGAQAHAFQAARQMWQQVGGYFGGDARMPAVSLDQPVPSHAYAAAYPAGHAWKGSAANEGSVTLSKAMQQALTDQQNPNRDYALGSLVHEMAHAFQSPDTLRTRQAREGGADAFNRQVSPGAIASSLLGNPASTQPSMPDYDSYVAQALARPAADSWVLHRQFRRGR